MGVANAAATAVSVLTALLAPAGSGPSSAGVIPEVSLDLENCTALPRSAVVRLVGLELDARVTSPETAGPHATRVAITCAPTGVQLNVSDPLSSLTLARTLALATREGDAAARIIALAVAELVFTSWLELSQTQAQPPPAPGAEPPPPALKRAAHERAQRHTLASGVAPVAAPTTPAPTEPAPTLVTATPAPVRATGPEGAYVLAVGQAIGPFQRLGLGWGAGVRVGWTSATPLFALSTSPAARPGAELDLTAAFAEADNAVGTVRVSSWSASPRAALRVFPGGGHGHGHAVWLDVAAGARLGVARLVGAPLDAGSTRGGSLAGTWGGAVAYLGIGLGLGSVVAGAGVEAGRVLRSVSGLVDGEQSVAIAGQWLSGSLAVGWGP